MKVYGSFSTPPPGAPLRFLGVFRVSKLPEPKYSISLRLPQRDFRVY